ncbi:MAG: M20/M25/M40 family metallo-hydrolase [Armatimonadetes bacterium]|nr:M20/M25/M40 family metallo-hydrolase [Armatimonadota bacterium]
MLRRLSFAILAAAIGGTALAQGDQATIDKILDEGMVRNQARQTLETFCGQFGARLTSSQALEKAQAWAMEQFKSYGCTNVHLEKWGEWPVGFDRAMSGHVGRMTAPFSRELQFTTPSWTPGTRGLTKGTAIMEPKSMDDLTAHMSDYKGKWLVLSSALPRRRPSASGETQAPDPRTLVIEAAFKAGILGTITPSRNDLVVTFGNYNITWDKLPTQTSIIVRKSDYDAMTGAMTAGQKVQLEFDIKQSFRKGPIAINNVVAEIKGTEKPDEVVIVSGHYDSWDGPGSQGALDNGNGSAVTMETARILMASGAKPKRTIRFILWSGEEQGLFGSRGYVKDHEAEMDKISCVLVDDGGTNYWGGFVGLETQRSMFQPSMDTLNTAFADMPMIFRAQEQMPKGGGSDHASFNAVGVPGFFTLETGVSDYNYVHHTQHDKIEAAINKYMIQSSTAAAVTSFNIACADGMMPRGPKPAPPVGG